MALWGLCLPLACCMLSLLCYMGAVCMLLSVIKKVDALWLCVNCLE